MTSLIRCDMGIAPFGREVLCPWPKMARPCKLSSYLKLYAIKLELPARLLTKSRRYYNMKTMNRVITILLVLTLAGFGLVGPAFAGSVSTQEQHNGNGYVWVAYQYDNTNYNGLTQAYANAQSSSVKTQGGLYPISQIQVSANIDEYILGNYNRQINLGSQTTYSSSLALVYTTYTSFPLDEYVMTSNHQFTLNGVEQWNAPALQTTTYGA